MHGIVWSFLRQTDANSGLVLRLTLKNGSWYYYSLGTSSVSEAAYFILNEASVITRVLSTDRYYKVICARYQIDWIFFDWVCQREWGVLYALVNLCYSQKSKRGFPSETFLFFTYMSIFFR